MEYGVLLLTGCAVLAAPVMAIVALVKIGNLKKQVANQSKAIAMLKARLDAGATGAAEIVTREEERRPAERVSAEEKLKAAQETPAEVWEKQSKPLTDEVAEDEPVEPERPAAKPEKSTSWLEEALAFRWLVWLGGATLALGGVFFIQYSMEQGLISPLVRIAAAIGLGGVLVFAGEWFRRRPLRKAIASIQPDYIPAAITAAGVAILYGSVFAGHGLYGMFAPLLAFTLLTAISLLALGLSLVQGPLIAALGMLGAYVVPLLIGSDEPRLWGLLSYLTVVGAAVLTLAHLRRWWWAAASTVVAAGLWSAMVLFFAESQLDFLALAFYILLTVGGAFSLMKFLPAVVEKSLWAQPLPAIFGAVCAGAVLLFGLAVADGNGPVSLMALAVFVVVTTFLAMRRPALEIVAPIPAILGLLVAITWTLPGAVYPFELEPIAVFGRLPVGGPMDDLGVFLASMAAFALFFSVMGYLALSRVGRPGLWALLSAAVPVLTLAVVYYRCQPLMVDLGWSVLGLLVAAAMVVLAGRLRDHPRGKELETGIGLYAVGAIGAISLAATMSLSEVWLSVALVLQLPALAWVNGRIPLPYCRQVSLVVGSIVFVRLVLLHTIFGTTFDVPAGTAWIAYGYGIPALAYFFAARWLYQERDSRTVHFLEGFAITAAVLTLSLEIRYWVNGSLIVDSYGLLEQSLQSMGWLASAFGFYLRYKRMPRMVSFWGARILGAMAVAQVVVLQLGFSNPLFTSDGVGTWPGVNLLLLAYGGPAVFAALFAWQGLRDGKPWLAWSAGGAALFLAFVNLTLEVRHWFQGEVIRIGRVTDAELYTYSAAWLVFAGLLMLAGFWRHIPVLRKAALGIVLIAVVKVFVLDMAGLEGLYRVASFMGLGASLLLVGFLYQRFVLIPERAGAD